MVDPWVLGEKVNKSINIIREANALYKNVALLWAGGKDSTAMLSLARRAFFVSRVENPGEFPFDVVFIDTTFQFRETYDYIKRVAAMWDISLVRTRNYEALYEGVRPDTHDMLECCSRLKTDALNHIIEKNDYDAVMVAIRWDEIEERGKEYPFSERDIPEHIRVHPMLHWSEEDIWSYIVEQLIPYNPLYDRYFIDGKKYRSLGCWPCTEPAEKYEREGRDSTRMERLRALGYM